MTKDLEYKFSGTEPPNVVPFIGNDKTFEEDLLQFEEWLNSSEPWSPDKAHYMNLICQLIENEVVPLETRHKAVRLLIKHSDFFKVVRGFYGNDYTEVLKKVAG